LDRFKRDFTVFDFGSGVEESSVGAEIARKYPNSVVITAEKDPIRYTPVGRLLWLKRDFSAYDLIRLSQCERYDVALALNILHWRSTDWESCLYGLRRLASWTFIQTPPPEDRVACGQAITPQIEAKLKNHGTYLDSTAQFPQHLARPIYLLDALSHTPTLSCKDWRSSDGEISVEVNASYSSKMVCFRHKDCRSEPYIPGMTLTTFTSLNGRWPLLHYLEKQIRCMVRPLRHGDLRPWNVRVDGRTAYAIDAEPFWTGDDEAGIQECLSHVREHYSTLEAVR
jgi:hypothetical protein